MSNPFVSCLFILIINQIEFIEMFNNKTTNCIYRLKISNETQLKECFSDQCSIYFDPIEILINFEECQDKLHSLTLSFSNYKNFLFFQNNLRPNKLSNYLSRKLHSQDQRQIKIFLDYLENDENPLNHQELLRLGSNLDFYQLFIRQINKTSFYPQSTFHYENYPHWNIFQVKFYCQQQTFFHEDSCPNEIQSPTIFDKNLCFNNHDENKILSKLNFSNQSQFMNQREKYFKHRLIILLLIICFLIGIFLLFLLLNRLNFNRDHLETTENDIEFSSSSLSSLSKHSLSNQRSKLRTISNDFDRAYQICSLPLPHEYSINKTNSNRF